MLSRCQMIRDSNCGGGGGSYDCGFLISDFGLQKIFMKKYTLLPLSTIPIKRTVGLTES